MAGAAPGAPGPHRPPPLSILCVGAGASQRRRGGKAVGGSRRALSVFRRRLAEWDVTLTTMHFYWLSEHFAPPSTGAVWSPPGRVAVPVFHR